MSENLEVIIQARIESLLGKEKIEQELAETAQRVSSIGKETTGRFSDLTGSEGFQFPELSKEEQKSFEKIQKAVEAQGRIIDEKSQELLKGYLEQEEIGLTSSQVKSWQRKFKQGGKESQKELEELTQFIEKEMTGVPEDKREYFEMLKTSVRDMADDVTEAYDDMSRSVREYHDNLKQTEQTQKDFFQQLQQAGYVALGGMVVQKGAEWAITGQKLEARERTAFDLTSPLQSFTERQLFELEKQQRERSLLYSTIGMAVGGVGGALVGGGAPGAIVGAGFGGTIGSQLAEYFNVEKEGITKEMLKLTQQTYQEAIQAVEQYRQFDIKATQLGVRTGLDVSEFKGSTGIGFTREQELEYKEYFTDMSRRFMSDLYEEQLRFARATGMSPEEVMRFNQYGRISGFDYNFVNLAATKQYATQIFGEDASSQRVIDILENIKNINMEMLKYDASADSREAIKLSTLPQLLFGIDNPYGRPGDLADKTLSYFESLGKPKTEAHEAFLFRAYSAGSESFFGEEGLIQRMGSGIFYKDNLQKILKQLEREFGQNEVALEGALQAMQQQGVPYEFIERMKDVVSGKGIEIATGFRTDEKGRYINKEGKVVDSWKEADVVTTTIKNVDELSAKMGEIINGFENIGGLTQEQIQQIILGGRDFQDTITEFESTQEKVSRIQGEIAESWKASILESQRRMADLEFTWLTSAKMQSDTIGKIYQGLEWMYDKLEIQGAFKDEETARKYYHNQKYKAVYDATGYKVSDVLDDDEIEEIKTNGGSVLDAYTKAAVTERTIVDNSKNPRGIDVKSMGYLLGTEEFKIDKESEKLLQKIQAEQEEIQKREKEAIEEIKARKYYNEESRKIEEELYNKSTNLDRAVESGLNLGKMVPDYEEETKSINSAFEQDTFNKTENISQTLRDAIMEAFADLEFRNDKEIHVNFYGFNKETRDELDNSIIG